MKTYQDFLAVGEDEKKRQQFIYAAIAEQQRVNFYKIAWAAREYFEKRNVTILEFQKWCYAVTGERIPDTISPNHKCSCGFFPWFIIQLNEYLLSNGVVFSNDKENKTKELLGGADFDEKIKFAGEAALWGGASFLFLNHNNDGSDKYHVEMFTSLEFVPLYDEESGALMAGIYYWQIDKNKPMRVTLYEIDGYTDYLFTNTTDENNGQILNPKREYKLKVSTSEVGGKEILNGENYPTLPIVPFWGNPEHQSEFVGMRELIDSYDLLLSGFANTVDEASELYWIIQNAGGMEEMSAIKFKNLLKRTNVAITDDASNISAHTLDIPYNAREAAMEQLRTNMYVKFGAFDTKEIYSGGVTATAIDTAYDNLDKKADRYESCVTKAIKGILALIGVDDTPTYNRSAQKNRTEEIDNILKAAQYLSPSYITKKILTILGDVDQYEAVMAEIIENEASRFAG